MPFEKIKEISTVFERSYTSKRFRASMRKIKHESTLMAQQLGEMQPDGTEQSQPVETVESQAAVSQGGDGFVAADAQARSGQPAPAT